MKKSQEKSPRESWRNPRKKLRKESREEYMKEFLKKSQYDSWNNHLKILKITPKMILGNPWRNL